MNTTCHECGREHRAGDNCPWCSPPVQTVVGQLVSSINAATPFELREAARALDDTANNPATNARDRKLYRALSDVVKLALK